MLDAVSLIRSALPKEADWLKQSGAVTQLSAAAMLLVSTLNEVFLQGKASKEPDDADRSAWNIRFDDGRRRLQEAGVAVADDVQRSLLSYLEQRKNWNGLVRGLGGAMAYLPAEIDPAVHLAKPARAPQASPPE
jgi:hypothetical protein